VPFQLTSKADIFLTDISYWHFSMILVLLIFLTDISN
jgi:hypothetical protein